MLSFTNIVALICLNINVMAMYSGHKRKQNEIKEEDVELSLAFPSVGAYGIGQPKNSEINNKNEVPSTSRSRKSSYILNSMEDFPQQAHQQAGAFPSAAFEIGNYPLEDPLFQIVSLSLRFYGIVWAKNQNNGDLLSRRIVEESKSERAKPERILGWIQNNLEEGSVARKEFDRIGTIILKAIAMFGLSFDTMLKEIREMDPKYVKLSANVDFLKPLMEQYFLYHELYRILENKMDSKYNNERLCLESTKEILLSKMITLCKVHGVAMNRLLPVVRNSGKIM